MTCKIAILTNDGLQTLEIFATYSDAEKVFDDYCQRYPYAHLEIFDVDDP